MSFSLKNTVKRLANDVNPFDSPQPASTARPQPSRSPQFSPVAQQRIMARNPSTGAQQIASGPNTPSNVGFGQLHMVTNNVPASVPVSPLAQQRIQARTGRPAPTTLNTGSNVAPKPAGPGLAHIVANNFGVATGLAAERAGVGLGQGTSGLVDLASPGTGNSRVTNVLNKAATSLDKRADNRGVTQAYKTLQVPINGATFLTPGAVTGGVNETLQGAKQLPTALKVVRPVINAVNKGDQLVNKIPFSNDAVGRIAQAATHGVIKPTSVMNIANGTAQAVGTQAAHGQKVTPADVAKTAAMNTAFSILMPSALQAAAEGAHGLHVAGKAATAATKEATGQTFNGLPKKQVIMDTRKLDLLHNAKQDLVTAHANVPLANQVNHGLRDLQQTHGLDFVTGSRGERLARIQQYLEQNGEAIPKLQAHQERMASFKPAALNEGGYVRNPLAKGDDPLAAPFQHDPSQAKFKGLQASKDFPNSYHDAKLGDALDYPALFKQHPELKDYTLKYHDVADTPGAYEGIHNPKAKTISLDKSLSDNEKLPALMHEIQHVIQGKEGRLDGQSSSNKLGYHGYKDNPIEVEARQVGEQYKAKPAPSTKLVPPQPRAAEPAPRPAAKDTGAVSSAKPKTGVADKQLNDLHTVRKQILSAETDDVLANHNAKVPAENLYKKVVSHGGISTRSADFAELPSAVKRNNGLPIDTVAKEMGYPDEHALYEALLNHRDSTKPITKAEAQDIAQQNLEGGKSNYSSDWQSIHQDIAKRSDELAQYPNGKYRQVKVTAKPQKMTDAELQSLSQTPEGAQPKATNKVLERNPKTAIRNADAERQVQDVLRKGGTTDEALNAYMKATNTDLQTAVKDVRRVAQESQLGFNGGKNPLEGSIKLPEVQAGDKDQAFLNADYVKQHEQAIGQKALDAFHGLSEHDKTLLQDIETDTVPNVAKRAENPAAFTAAEKQIRTYYDTRHAYDHALGIDVGYRANYLRQLFAKAEDQAKLSQPEQINIKAGNKRPGYTQKREYDTLNTNVGDALERDINGSSTNHAKLAYAKGLDQAFPDKTNTSGQLVKGDTGNYLQLTNKYGQGVTASPEIAKSINVRTRPDQPTGNLARYDKFNAGLKQVKLGGGAFHAVTEAGTFVGQQLASGKLFKDPKASAGAFRSFFSPKFMEKETNRLANDHAVNPDGRSTDDRAALSGLKSAPKDVVADANVSLTNKAFHYTGIKALHDATFQRELPYLKKVTFEQKTKGLSTDNPADLQKMRDVAKGINDEIGGLNRDIEGSIKPATFQRTQRFLLATDFTEGKIRTIMSALSKGGEQGRLAREIVVGKAILFGGLTVAGGVAYGDYKDKTAKQNAVQIAKSLIDPTFRAGRYSVALPNTYASEFIRPFEPLFKSKNGAGANATTADRLKGFQKYGVNRLAAAPSEALQLISNKDASGNRIYGNDYKFKGGGPISPAKTATNVASGFVPIPASQAIGVGTGKTAIAPAVANVAGLRVTNEDAYNQAKARNNGTTAVDKLKTAEKDANKKLKSSLSPEDQKLSTLSKADRQKLIDNGSYTKAKFDGLDNYVNNEKRQLGLPVSKSSVGINSKLDTSSKQFLTKYNAMSADDRKKAATTQNDFEYKAKSAQYANDKANNKLTRAQDISTQASLAKDKVGSSFSKDTRDLYGLSKSEVYDLITSDPNGNKTAQDLLAYGDALDNAGVGTNKFRTSKGAVAFKPKETGSSGSSGKKDISSFISMSQAGRKAASNNQDALLKLVRGAKIAGKNQPRVKVASVTLKKQRTNKKAKATA